MATLAQLHDEMWAFNQAVAYGGECNAWGDFVADSYEHFGVGPWHDQDPPQLPEYFSEYWQAVANGESADYAAHTGARIA